MNFDCFRLLIFSFVFPLWLSSVHLKPFFSVVGPFQKLTRCFLFMFLSSPYWLIDCLHFKFSFFRAIIFKSSLILSVLFTISIYVCLYTFVIICLSIFFEGGGGNDSFFPGLGVEQVSFGKAGQILENVGGIFRKQKKLLGSRWGIWLSKQIRAYFHFCVWCLVTTFDTVLLALCLIRANDASAPATCLLYTHIHRYYSG